MLNAMITGNKIAEARKNNKLSQAGLATQLSVSSQAVGKWERGESIPDIITFDRMAKIFGVDLNYFSENFDSYSKEENNNEQENVSAKNRRAEWNMSGGDWRDADFSGLKNLSKKFSGSNIKNCQFNESELSEMTLNGNNVIDCVFSKSNLAGSQFSGSNIQKNAFEQCNLTNTVFFGSHLDRCDFSSSDFTGAIFKGSSFIKNKITDTVWNQTEFRGTGFSEIIFEGSISECSFINCNYSKCEFRNVILNNVFFKGGKIKKIVFTNCKADSLTYAFLKSGKADLKNVELISNENA